MDPPSDGACPPKPRPPFFLGKKESSIKLGGKQFFFWGGGGGWLEIKYFVLDFFLVVIFYLTFYFSLYPIRVLKVAKLQDQGWIKWKIM
jgi:hypothetical protein